MTPPPTGSAVALDPLVTRVLAPNASPYTFTGTQTHLVGGGDDLAIIDPGPADEAHHAALLAAIAGRPVRAILVTHHHRDHSLGAPALARATCAPVVGAAPFASEDRAFDPGYAPDRVLAEGEGVAGAGWSLVAIATPGHTSNHLAFALPEAGALFSGDHVMGWSTTIVSPPDGDMGDYMASLEKLLARDDRVYFPGHGEAVSDPRRLVRGMLGHRRQREGQILRLLERGTPDVPGLVGAMYAGLDVRLVPAAERSVLAHLIELERQGAVAADDGRWSRVA